MSRSRASLAADWSDEARIRLWAEEHGKTLFVVDRNLQWPPRDADDRERWNNGVEQARREWESTSKRYRRAQAYLRDQAFFVGKKPYGYRIVTVPGSGRTPEDDHKTLEPDPVTSPIVREMARLYLDGQSFREIRDWLTSRALPVPQQPKDRTGRGWTSQAVRRILSNQAIAGRVQTNGRTVLRVEPIITMEQFRQMERLMKSRATRGSAARETALLTGILVCKDGNPMYRIKGRSVPSCPDGFYYYCSAEICPKGDRMLVPLAYLDAAVNDVVMAMADLPHVVIKVTPGNDHSEEIAHIKKDIAELNVESATYDSDLARLRAEIARLREIDRTEAKASKTDVKPDGRTIGGVWESLDTASRRQWLLARKGSNWLPGQDRVRVQVNGRRDPELGIWPIDIDLGEYTDSILSLAII